MVLHVPGNKAIQMQQTDHIVPVVWILVQMKKKIKQEILFVHYI